jgi:putative PIN family toxin of toxin-antitoxin system
MARIVIDANVIISAAYGGKPLEAVTRAMEDHDVYISEPIMRELEEVFPKLAKKLSRDQIGFIQQKSRQLVGLAHWILISERLALSRDPKDDHYLSLCKKVKADFLITGDKDLLSLSSEDLRKKGVSCLMVTPKSFLEMIF